MNKNGIASLKICALSVALLTAGCGGGTTSSTGTAGLSGVDTAKKLFADLRTTSTAMSDTTETGALDTRAQQMKADFDLAIAPLDQDLIHWMSLTTGGIDYFLAYKTGANTSTSMPLFVGGVQIGGCTIYSDATAQTTATSASDALNVGCSINRKTVPGSTPALGHQVTDAIVMTPATGQSMPYQSFTYAARARLETLVNGVRDTSQDVTVGNYGDVNNRATGTIDYRKSGEIATSLVLQGMMPARTDDFGVALTDNETWDIGVTRTPEANSVFKYDFTGAITANKGGAAVGKISINPGSFARVAQDAAGHGQRNAADELSVSLSANAGGTTLTGVLAANTGVADKTGAKFIPTHATFTGKLATSNTEFFTGTLTLDVSDYDKFDSTLDESASNFAKKTATWVGTLTIPARPVLTVNISAKDEAFNSSTVNARYTDGASDITIAVVESGTAPVETTVSSTSGVSFKLVEPARSAPVMKDNVEVATINLNTGMIAYKDGSSESLK